jgi:hypothetical protein
MCGSKRRICCCKITFTSSSHIRGIMPQGLSRPYCNLDVMKNHSYSSSQLHTLPRHTERATRIVTRLSGFVSERTKYQAGTRATAIVPGSYQASTELVPLSTRDLESHGLGSLVSSPIEKRAQSACDSFALILQITATPRRARVVVNAATTRRPRHSIHGLTYQRLKWIDIRVRERARTAQQRTCKLNATIKRACAHR